MHRVIIFQAIAAVVTLFAGSSLAIAQPADVQPNVVLIFADDLGYGDLSCYGAKNIKTPHLDRMAAEGVRLTQFYVPAPACSPARAALLTGRYPVRAGMPRVLGPLAHHGLDQSELTLAEALKERGYATAIVGKWHLGHWVSYLPTRHGFDSYFGIPYSNDMNKEEMGFPPIPLLRDETVIEQPVDQDFLTQRYTDEAIHFIRESKDRPFFLYLAHSMPHVPLHVSPQFRGRSAGGLYGDVIEEMDWSTGRIVETLEQLGLSDRTLVIFTSDNGPWLTKGEHGGSAGALRNGKATVYEGGVRVPFVARWPGHLPKGKVIDEPLIIMDLMPTIVALAGGAMPSDRVIDGRNIWNVLAGSGAREGNEFHFEWKGQRAIRSGKWKFHLPRVEPLQVYEAELYDLETDPRESKNLAGDHPEIVQRLTQRIEAHDADAGKAP